MLKVCVRILLAGPVGAVLLISQAWAQTARLGPEFQVNTYTTGFQELARVSRNSSGEFVVAWESEPQDGSGGGVFAQRFDSSGQRVGAEFRVNSYTTGRQGVPAVSIDSLGRFAIVWQSDLQDGSLAGIYGQRYAAGGLPAGTEFRANTYTTSDQVRPSLDHDSAGNFVIVWGSDGQDRSYSGIFGQRYDSAGVKTGSEFRVNSYTREDQDDPVVSREPGGKFVVTWQSYAQDSSGDGIFGQRYTSAGGTSGNEFRVNTYTILDQGRPSVATDSTGNFVVVWESYQDGSGRGVYGQRYNSSGTKLGGEFRVNSYTLGHQDNPSIAMADTGGFVVVWQSSLQDGSASGIYGQRYDSSGAPRGLEFRVNTTTLGDQRQPHVSMDGVGNFVAVWTSVGQDGSQTGVFGQRFSFTNCVLPAASVPSTATACQGGTAFITVTPSGVGPFSYQWRKGGVPLTDGAVIRGTRAQTLRIGPVAPSHAGSYDCVVTDYCLPSAMTTSNTATLTVTSGTVPGAVTGLKIQRVGGGGSLKLTWNNTTNASDYVAYEDPAPNGAFTTVAGTSTSGVTGLTVPLPAGNRHYLVAGRNATCGVGPQQ